MKGAAKFDALQRALETRSPRCAGDKRFMRDNLTPDAVSVLRRICWACPVYVQCREFAEAARPEDLGGIVWAGQVRTTRGREAVA